MNQALQITFTVSLAYCASFLAVSWIAPAQRAILPASPELASLFFLPHGVRVLAFFFFGWMAAAYLLPGKLIMWAAMTFLFGQTSLNAWGSLISLASCLVAYELTKVIFKDTIQSGRKFSWQMVMTMGLMSSLLNAVGLTLLQSQEPKLTVMKAYILGDMLGLTCLMLGLMFYFRWIDQRST